MEKLREKSFMDAAVELKDVVKTFVGGITAVDHISLKLEEGTLYGLVGPNGAGKSTLTNLISGYLMPDKGEIFVHGVPIIDYHQAMIEAGVVKIEQHPNLAYDLTPLEHLALILPGFIPNTDVLRDRAEELLKNLNAHVDLDRKVEDLPISQQRVFEIVKALIICELLHKAGKKPILILDEATAFLQLQQKTALKEFIRRYLPLGYTIIWISHDLAEVIDVSDEILVMSVGKIVSRMKTASLEVSDLVKSMFETVPVSESAAERGTIVSHDPALTITDLNVRDDRGVLAVKNLNLTVYKGEIHGIAVIPGTGEKELAECIYGLRKADRGKIIFFGQDITNKPIYEVKKLGISFLSDDRIRDGLIPIASVEDNLTIGSDEFFTSAKGLIIDKKLKEKLAKKLIEEFSIVTKGLKAPVTTLSGGNMQRVYLARVMGRWAKLLIALHPTVGLDPMGTKIFFDKVGERKRKGLTTMIISPNVKELLTFCDRVSAMYEGRILGTFRSDEVTVEKLGMMVSGMVEA